MKIIYIGGEELAENTDSYSLCLGMFDGVHLGHRALVSKTLEVAKEKNLRSGAVTFLSPVPADRIYLFEQQAELFAECGLDTLFVILFNRSFKKTSPSVFVRDYLCGYMNAKHVVCGSDFSFGTDRSGDVNTIAALSGDYGYTYDIIPKLSKGDSVISSSLIRNLLEDGRVKKANELLGKEYYISGCVENGFQLGRTIGFPTANIGISQCLCRLKKGVYESRVEIDGKIWLGITNIGTAPTAGKEKAVLSETYVIGYDGNLYNKNISVSLIDYLREEKKFSGLDELKAVISENIRTVCERQSF